MREYKAIFICILICNVFVCPKSFGQTDYTYEKGKSFKNTNALSMTDTIDLTSISSPIPYKKSIPGHIQTIACPVRLPGYVRGIFFSRDSRPGDFEWPNNTNRLLPWVFGVETLVWIRVYNSWFRDPSLDQQSEPFPVHSVTLTSSLQRF